MTHPVLVETEGSIHGLTSRMQPRNGDSGLRISPGPLEGPLLAKARHDSRHGAQKEGIMNRRFQQGLVCAVRGQTDFGLWSKEESGLHINCLEMLAVCQACQFCLLYIKGHHMLVTLRPAGPWCHTLNPQAAFVSERPLHAGDGPSLCVSTDGRAHCAGPNNEPRKASMLSRNNYLLRKGVLPPARRVQKIWEVLAELGRPPCASKDNSMPTIFYENYGYPDPRVAQSSALCFPSSRSDTAGTQASQGTMAQTSFDSPLWRNQPWVSELFQLLIAAPWLIPLRRDLLSQANGTIWHPRPEL